MNQLCGQLYSSKQLNIINENTSDDTNQKIKQFYFKFVSNVKQLKNKSIKDIQNFISEIKNKSLTKKIIDKFNLENLLSKDKLKHFIEIKQSNNNTKQEIIIQIDKNNLINYYNEIKNNFLFNKFSKKNKIISLCIMSFLGTAQLINLSYTGLENIISQLEKKKSSFIPVSVLSIKLNKYLIFNKTLILENNAKEISEDKYLSNIKTIKQLNNQIHGSTFILLFTHCLLNIGSKIIDSLLK